jgi:hypothetical protein
MDELDDVIASFSSVLEHKGDPLHSEIFGLTDQVRAELASGLRALSEARDVADENQALFQKILAHVQDSEWLDRRLAHFSAEDKEMDRRQHELEAELAASIADRERELHSRSLSPSNRALVKASIKRTRQLIKESKRTHKLFLANRRRQYELFRVVNSVNKLPAELASITFAEAVTHPWGKGLVDKLQLQQIKVRIQQAAKEELNLLHEEGIASKLQLVLQFAMDRWGVVAQLLEVYRTLKNRDFTHPEDIQALRNIVPHACKLRDYQLGLRQLIVATVNRLDELRAKMEA